MSRQEQILEAFLKFHAENPDVWDLWKRYTFQLIASGNSKGGAGNVSERIRWHSLIRTRGESVKLNNNYRAYYARMFDAKYPEYDGFFRVRKMISADKPTYEEHIDVVEQDEPNADLESVLSNRLAEVA